MKTFWNWKVNTKYYENFERKLGYFENPGVMKAIESCEYATLVINRILKTITKDTQL